MKESQFQYKIGRFIIISNVVIFALVGVGYLTPGFVDETESMGVLKVLAPITTIYMAAVIKFMIANKNKDDSESVSTVNKGYAKITTFIVLGHFTVLAGLLLLKILNGRFGMEQLTTSITVLETFFGAYVGMIIADLFQTNSKEGATTPQNP